MMVVNVQVARAFDFEIEETVTREQRQHMVEESDAGFNLRLAAPVERERDANIGFVCAARYFAAPRRRLRALDDILFLQFGAHRFRQLLC
jgi:hypothetical protein